MTSPPASPTAIRSALRQIRGDLFDVDSSNAAFAKLADAVQRLAEAENEVVRRQKEEIDGLRDELESARRRTARRRPSERRRERRRPDDRDVVSSGSFSDGSVDEFEKELAAKATFARAKDALGDEIEELDETKAKIHQEIQTLRRQVSLLSEERTALIEEVQSHAHIRQLSQELEEAIDQISDLQSQIKRLHLQMSALAAEKESALAEIETRSLVRSEMEREMTLLYREKIDLEAQLENIRSGGTTVASSTVAPSSSFASSFEEEDAVSKLKREISEIKAENESLRVSAKKEAATLARMERQIKSLNLENLVIKNGVFEDSKEVLSVKKKRVLAWSQGSFHTDDGTSNHKSLIDYQPTISSGGGSAAGSGSDYHSASHESDNVSVLFGRDSIAGGGAGAGDGSGNAEAGRGGSAVAGDDDSDHKGIRAHAERLLYWANKAAERSKSPSPSAASGPLRGGGGRSSARRRSSVPTTIGLPPRGSSGEKKRSLPPRPPADGASVGNATNKSDKENGGAAFNIPKRPAGDKAVIFNLDRVQSSSSETFCRCSSSPFSGDDAHSEFYLPKLGLACTCGRSAPASDRVSFSKNPTALGNILRSWQCDFLRSLGIETADQLLRAHKKGANDMARKMKVWREENNLPLARSKECYVALMVWSRTAKVVLRSIEKQKEAGGEFIEKPGFLDIACSDTYTVCSMSTLGQMSSVGGRVYEMMEI